jgi:hypothetical protein
LPEKLDEKQPIEHFSFFSTFRGEDPFFFFWFPFSNFSGMLLHEIFHQEKRVNRQYHTRMAQLIGMAMGNLVISLADLLWRPFRRPSA